MYSLNQTKFLSDAELGALNKTLARYRFLDPLPVLLIELALKTGARAQEMLNIRLKDLNQENETVLIKGLKGSCDREIPINSDLFSRLKIHVNEFDKIKYNRLRHLWLLYRPVVKSFHGLRHTFAIELFKRTRDLQLVQQALGHKSIQNTMVYARYIYSTQEMKRILA